MNEYVLFPKLNGSDKVYVLINRNCCPQPLFDDKENEKYVYLEPGDYLCKKWSDDLLKKFGSTHYMDKESIFYFVKYTRFIDQQEYLLYRILEETLSVNADDDIYNFMKKNDYTFIFPSYKVDITIGRSFIEFMYLNNYLCDSNPINIIIHLSKKLSSHISLKCGRLISWLYYYYIDICKGKIITNTLKENGVIDIEKLNIRTPGGTHFYSGYIRNHFGIKKVFVKSYDLINTLVQENIFYEKYIQDRNDLSIRKLPSFNDLNLCVYEYCDGVTLNEYCKNKVLTASEFKLLQDFLLNLLSLFEDKGLEYGDLRPENIMVGLGASISFKICDWGWAKSINQEVHKGRLVSFFEKNLGDSYRFSKYKISDLYSAYWILVQYKPVEYKIDGSFEKRIIKQIVKEIYETSVHNLE